MIKRATKKKIGFFVMPTIFAASFCLIVLLCLAPVYKIGANIYSLLLLENDVTFGENEKSVFFENTNTGDTIKSSRIVYPKIGEQFGLIEIGSIGLQQNLFFGDSPNNLSRGVAQFAGSSFPGEGSTCLLAGHNTKNIFGRLSEVKEGDLVQITTNYGVYVYKVTTTAVVSEAEAENAVSLDSKVENLVLYTCYPFNSLGRYSQRFIVYCEYVSGPQVLLGQ